MSSTAYDIKVLFDGDCPLCRREIAWVKRRDKNNRVAVEDIAAPEFDPSRYGRTQDQVMAEIHGVLPDGTVVRGLEVFRVLYRAIGMSWMAAWTGWPVLRWFADLGYKVFAKYRTRLPFRRKCEPGDACRVS
jgi:predicted DCC family thiol-disulfide oxidoreductase YuxK